MDEQDGFDTSQLTKLVMSQREIIATLAKSVAELTTVVGTMNNRLGTVERHVNRIHAKRLNDAMAAFDRG